MPNLIRSGNCLTAWRDVCNHMITNGDGSNMVVLIENPLAYPHAHLDEITNSGIITAWSLSDVVNTIFPAKLYNRNPALSVSSFYDLHERICIRGKTMHRKNRSSWGNYFLRFTRFGDTKHNQLQAIIDAINNRLNRYAACYMMHVSSVDYDNNVKPRGNPCLQYVQFEQTNNSLNLTAVYRSHDFYNRALGNYIGLSELLSFVCTQTRHQMGSVFCHSIHYFLDQKRFVGNCISNFTW